MIIKDMRTQKRVLKINFTMYNCDFDLDGLVDDILKEVEIICGQRKKTATLDVDTYIE